MTPANIAALRERVQLFGRLVAAVFGLVREAGGIAQAVAHLNAKPGAQPVSIIKFLSSLTIGQIKGYVDQAESLSGPLHDIRSVIDHHGKDLREDARVGLEWIKLILPKLAIIPGPYMAAFAFAALLISGTPHNSGEGGIGSAPEGNSNSGIGA